MSMLRRLLLFVLMLSLTPGLTELLENLEHILHDGHLAHGLSDHDGEDDAHAALEAEHGCTPMNHSCGCHVSVPVILVDLLPTAPPPGVLLAATFHPTRDGGPLNRANAPPVPPPSA